MSYSISEFMVMLDEGNGTSFSIDVANAMAESIDSRFDYGRTDSEKAEIREGFRELTNAMRRVWGDECVNDNVACPES